MFKRFKKPRVRRTKKAKGTKRTKAGTRITSRRSSSSKRKHQRDKSRKLDTTKLKDWSILVRSRDSFTCVSCGSKKKTHAHHMVSKYYRPRYAYLEGNGITLCASCHIGGRGIHGKDKPKTKLISLLRTIYRLHDIDGAKRISANRDRFRAS